MEQSNQECFPRLQDGQEWVIVHNGESGDRVYRRSDGLAYGKRAEGVNVARLEEERHRAEWLSATGIGCPRVLDWMVTDRGACLVTSAIPGVPACELTASELIHAWPSIAQLMKALHDLPVADCPFERGLARMFHVAEEVVARGAVNPSFLDPNDRDTPPAMLLHRLRNEMPRRLDQEPHDLVVCHGDACLPNFLIDPDTLNCTGMIDLGRLGTADRYVDFSLLLANSRELWGESEYARAAYSRLFEIHAIEHPDQERLDFYLRLDPLTWGL